MMKSQVIVVGAGPSGSTTAFYLAQRGIDVLLVDKEQWPRDKVCGDGQMNHAWEIYKEMGIYEEAKAAANMAVSGTRFVSASEQIVTLDYKKKNMFATRRYVIDDIIRRAAVREGAHFLENFEVTGIIYKRGRVKGVKALYNGVETEAYADLVIFANGSHSMQARELGIFNEDPDTLWLGARGYYENVRGMIDGSEFFYPFEDMYPAGYMWIFPEGDGIANVGVFITAEALLKSGQRLEDYFDRWRDETKIGQERLGEARLIGEIKGWRLPSCRQMGKMYSKGAIMVGDAANCIECWLGEGFFEAMNCGRRTGIFIGDLLKKGKEITDEDLERLNQEYAAEINPFYAAMATCRDKVFCTPERLDEWATWVNESGLLDKEEGAPNSIALCMQFIKEKGY